VCDGGVVIDLSAMNRVEVDTGKGVARAQGHWSAIWIRPRSASPWRPHRVVAPLSESPASHSAEVKAS
jgi:hypothetical protein